LGAASRSMRTGRTFRGNSKFSNFSPENHDSKTRLFRNNRSGLS
jgi:hypothetical protein